MMRRAVRGFLGMLCLLGAGCSTTAAPHRAEGTASAPVAFRLLGTQVFAHAQQFGGTTVGGLSGIDRDVDSGVYFLISDDRSVVAPNRFYTARLAIDESGFHDATLQTVVTLLAPDGRPYERNEADSEAIRFDPRSHSVWWTSEGLRTIRGRTGSRLIDPFVRQSGLDGRPLADVPLDPMFHVVASARGPRDNVAFEGLSLSPDGESLWVAMEGPLLNDGPMATMTTGAWARISRHPRQAAGSFGPLDAQYAYPVDPVPSAGAWTSWLGQNGVSEVLAIDATHLFVLERAFVIGGGWRIRLFEADVEAATDVRGIDSLAADGVAFVR